MRFHDELRKIERVDVSNKCMEADNKLSGVKQETCVDSALAEIRSMSQRS